MTRKFTPLADRRAQGNLEALLHSNNDHTAYRQAMTKIGYDLGRTIKNELVSIDSTYLAFTVEDADFLAQGMMDYLVTDDENLAGVACFWNGQSMAGESKSTPILKVYKEPAQDIKTLVIVKSIISSACVVKTNLTKLIDEINPEQILIVAPVMFDGSETQLREEFPESISSLFNFITFAIDDLRMENGNINPGIGGSVYENLGFGDAVEKNTYIPKLVKERRAALGG